MNDTSSLLVRLRKYRPRAARDSREDFVTEVFGWILEQYEEFSQFFLERLSKNGELFLLPSDLPQWRTQFHLRGERPDMVALTDTVALIFEHKVGDSLSQDQVERYREAGKQVFRHLPVVIIGITGNMLEQTESVDVPLTWKDVHEWVSEFVDNGSVNADRERRLMEFQELLRHEGLGPSEPINPEAVRYYLLAAPLIDQLLAVYSSLLEEKWSVPSEYKVVFRDRSRHRIGIEFWRSDSQCEWSPGVFLGCVVDGRDHMIAERLTEIRFQLILDFDQILDGHYQRMPAYRKLLDSLHEQVVGTEWKFYDHLQEPNPNTWHPLYIERPLLDVLAGTRTADEQRAAILSAGQTVLGFLNHDNVLKDVMADCDRYFEEYAKR